MSPVGAGQNRLEYHRLYRGLPRYRWWKPLLAGIVALLYCGIASSTLLAVFLVVTSAVTSATGTPSEFFLPDGQVNQVAFSGIDAASPVSLLMNLGLVAVWMPCILLALWTVGIRPTGRITSVAFRIRWRWLASCLLPAAVATAAMMVLGAVVVPAIQGESLFAPSTPPGTFLLCALVILLVTPFQAAAEEYAFRGGLMQIMGAWVRWRWLAISLPTLLFALAHNYDIWGLIDVALFGITAAWITWRTGGLEAAIVLHALNNIALFLLLSSGMNGSTVVQNSTGGPIILTGTVVMMAIFVLWIERLRRRQRLVTTAAPDSEGSGAPRGWAEATPSRLNPTRPSNTQGDFR